ncbi:hypothetical protein R1flu_026866 [Riccia fluitans]|uniref:Uncharacterized protein n=1 Tax=Riccia fluitans TaxID=41844 RepID=A0ABD1XL91_9MARC
MICVGTSGCQFRWELQLRPPKIHPQRRGRSCGKQKLHQQQNRQIHSSLEAPARPTPNFPHTSPSISLLRIETTGRFFSFTSPLGFRPRTHQKKWEILDLVALDTGVEGRRGGTGTGKSPYASGLRQSSSEKVTFALPTLRSEELNNLRARRIPTSVRAEGISKERRNGRSPNYQKDRESGEDGIEGLPEDTNMWDSNAEGIRRGKPRMRSSATTEAPLRDRRSKNPQELDDADEVRRIPRNWSNKQEEQQQRQRQQWEFDDGEYRTGARIKEEWDYDAEGSDGDRTARGRQPQAESSRWWQPSENTSSYESYGETEASTGFQDFFSSINMDLKDAFLFIRWGLPAAVLLVPWVVSNPMMLLLGLSFIPAANKLIFPIASQIFRTVMSGGSPPKSRRKRKQSTASSSASRRKQAQRASAYYERETTAASTSESYPDQEGDILSSVASTIFGDGIDDDLPRRPPRLGGSSGTRGVSRKLGGWDELEQDRARARSERWPMERMSSRSEKKIVRREQNIFIRLLLVLFPFLRSWGGLIEAYWDMVKEEHSFVSRSKLPDFLLPSNFQEWAPQKGM